MIQSDTLAALPSATLPRDRCQGRAACQPVCVSVCVCVPVISVSVSEGGGLAAEGVKEQGSEGGAMREGGRRGQPALCSPVMKHESWKWTQMGIIKGDGIFPQSSEV